MCLQVKDDRKAQEMFNLADYERSEELRKAKSRSKKNHSRFILLRCKRPGNTVSVWPLHLPGAEATCSRRAQSSGGPAAMLAVSISLAPVGGAATRPGPA